MENQKPTNLVIQDRSIYAEVDNMKRWAQMVIDSNLLPDDITTPEQVITIVQHGRELGLKHHIALNNIHVIQGRPTVSAAMLGALLKRAGVEWIITKDYEPANSPGGKKDRVTEYKFFWKSKITGKTMEATHQVSWVQLTLAGYTKKENYLKYPKEMMRARCLSSAVRALFPEVLMGMYTDIELNDALDQDMPVIVTDDGEVRIKYSEREVKKPIPAPEDLDKISKATEVVAADSESK